MSSIQKVDTEIKREAIDRAREILRGDRVIGVEEIESLCRELEGKDQFSYATELLLVKMRLNAEMKKQSSTHEHETLARYIYNDHSLPSFIKFDRAITELEIYCDLLNTATCETLGLAGAIYKYKWLYDHKFVNLDLSRSYYKRGFDSWKRYTALTQKTGQEHCNDQGYTAINFAYINELIAIDRIEETGSKLNDFTAVERLLEEARVVRMFVLIELGANAIKPGEHLPAFWLLAIIAESYFGLTDYENAMKFIKLAIAKKKIDLDAAGEGETLAWQLRSFHKQLNSLAFLQHSLQAWVKKNKTSDYLTAWAQRISISKINDCLSILANPTTDGHVTRPEEAIREEGKLGLALSGGGFRAAIYHIGVLAALAEQNILKDVEVISCVSGGSIIGAFYYLKLKKELESKPDGAINYIQIVSEIEVEFLAGVQKNLRMRVFSNFWANLKMVATQKYSRTHRLGELYEKHLYKSILKKEGELYMDDLFIKPYNNPDFSLSTDNWKRIHKIPQLILNATTVNTGHNWQFTASWMGEPPGYILQGIDMKPRLRRMYYRDAPGEYKKFRLGHAVGASSCVPILFEPLPMFDLYEGGDKPLEIQLIDGGLHDNQGIAALLEQECKNMIISDASGQMTLQSGSSASELSVFYRADTILQERLRELQFQDISERHNTAQINSLTSLHLKSDLQLKPISWLKCQDVPRKLFDTDDDSNPLTRYGVLRDTQKLLSEIRTDLDSFHDIESYALMYSGYIQTLHKIRSNESTSSIEVSGNWKFLQIKPYLSEKSKAQEIASPLKISNKIALKVFHLSKPVKVAALLIGSFLLWLLITLGIQHWSDTILALSTKEIAVIIAVFMIGYVSDFIAGLINYQAYLRKKLLLLVLGIGGFIAFNIYLLILNPLYLRAGKVPDEK